VPIAIAATAKSIAAEPGEGAVVPTFEVLAVVSLSAVELARVALRTWVGPGPSAPVVVDWELVADVLAEAVVFDAAVPFWAWLGPTTM
jgi:hypothetical protein